MNAPIPRYSDHLPTVSLPARYVAVRRHSIRLSEPLSAEDCCVQSMPDASPVKWHLAHTTWFFETFVLERFESGFQPQHPAFRVLFNSYYNRIGEKYPRPQRGLLTRPSLQEVLAYRHNVDARVAALLATEHAPERDAELAQLLELGLQHEQQHQELMLTDIKHLLSMNPLKPAYCSIPMAAAPQPAALEWLRFDAGLQAIGHATDGFCFDNELPRHRQFVEPYAIASRLVSNAEFQAFIEAGGYREPVLWLSDGWDWVCANQLAHPLYWQHGPSGWSEFTLHGMQPLAAHAAAIHLSYFEADAYARWAGARLPTEAEWERAATSMTANSVARLVSADSAQWFGSAWQWTSSSYAPYPGFVAAEGAVGEYNGKFMVNQYVLRGSSIVTPDDHARSSYRNFFPASARWQYSGVRLAKSYS
jgi:ergothioneine biosynthesis protein EgtB